MIDFAIAQAIVHCCHVYALIVRIRKTTRQGTTPSLRCQEAIMPIESLYSPLRASHSPAIPAENPENLQDMSWPCSFESRDTCPNPQQHRKGTAMHVGYFCSSRRKLSAATKTLGLPHGSHIADRNASFWETQRMCFGGVEGYVIASLSTPRL